MNEIIEKRDLYSKTYSDDGRHFQSKIYSAPIHYLKDNDEWDDINIYLYSKSDKYIVEKNNVTVGFRKDGDLYKYFGLRYDYDHQFESTFVSIQFNDEEQLEGITEFTNIVKESDNTISHYIGDLRIYNEVYKTYFRNYVQVDSSISKFTSTEQIHLKGLQIANDFSGTTGYDLSGETIWTEGIYIPDENDEFYIIDEEWNFKFKIPKPIMKDNSGNTINHPIKHNLIYSGGTYLYEKTTTDLDNFDYPLLIDGSASYFNIINDSMIADTSGLDESDWNYVRDGEDSLSLITTPLYAKFSIQNSFESGESTTMYRSYLSVDTILPSNINITNISINLYCNQKYTNNRIAITDGNFSTPITNSKSNWLSAVSTIFSTGYTTLNSYNIFYLNNNGFLDFNKTGNNKYSIIEYDYDYLDIYHNKSVSYNESLTTGSTFLSFESNKPPYLQVDYIQSSFPALSINPVNTIYGESSTQWYINSRDTDLTTQLSNFNAFKLFHLYYLSGTTTATTKIIDNVSYRDIEIKKSSSDISDDEFNSFALTDLNDIIEIELTSGTTNYLITTDITSITSNSSTITIRLSGTSIDTSSYNTTIIYKNRYNDNLEELGNRLYNNLNYEDIDGTYYTTFTINKSLKWDKTYFIDDVYKTSGIKFNGGTFKGGTFSANWSSGIWNSGTWNGNNLKNNNLSLPKSQRVKSFQRNNLKRYQSFSQWRRKIKFNWWKR